jgi:photosynthesis system II assembly factor YCF48-like protein/putative zinc finger protein
MQDVPKIVLKRLQETMSAEAHPDADLLTGFAEQSLGESERTRVMEHLARCSDCREVVAVALPASEVVAVKTSTNPTRAGWLSLPVLRWSVAIAGVIAITSFGVLQYRQHQKNEALGSNLIARNEPAANAVQSLPPSPAPSKSQKFILPAQNDKQAQKEKRLPPRGGSQSDSTDYFSSTQQAHQVNRATPAVGVMHGAASGGVAGGNFALGSASGASVAPKAVVSSPANAPVVVGDLKNATPEETAKLAPSLSGGRAGGAPSSAQTVEVAPQSEEVTATAEKQVSDQVMESQKEQPSQYQSSATLGVVEARDAATMSNLELATPRWSISAEGGLQRSFDGGQTWVEVNPEKLGSKPGNTRNPLKKKKTEVQGNPHPLFRAVSATGAEVWAGGSAAMLFHSVDGGLRWARVVPSESGALLTGDITSVEFSDSQHGRIATSSGEAWITADGGKTWRRP